jgi:hypothetical protein
MNERILNLMVQGYGPKGHLGSLDFPAAAIADIERAEQRLNFPLPPLLAALYIQLGNGGFGPEVIGLLGGAVDENGRSIVELYELMRLSDPTDHTWQWPEKLVPFVDWGCAIKSCIDCSAAPYQVVRFDPNGHTDTSSWDDAFHSESPSLEAWFEGWLNDVSR